VSTALGVDRDAFAIDAFACPKAGNTLEEYEDAWSARPVAGSGGHRIAIADGATESSFSRLWAALLVECWTRGDATGPGFFERLGAARRLWRLRVAGRPLPWYAAEKARHGAFAAFLGVEVDGAARGWRAVAVGDCCLFQLDAARPQMRVVQAFPLTRSQEFGSSPYLVGSDPSGTAALGAHIRVSQGQLRDEDMLVIASDTLAAWLLWRQEEGRPVWKWLGMELRGQAWFARLVDIARRDRLRNDDMTLLRVIFHD